MRCSGGWQAIFVERSSTVGKDIAGSGDFEAEIIDPEGSFPGCLAKIVFGEVLG